MACYSYFVIDLMQLRSENMADTFHLAELCLDFFIKLLQNGTDLSTVVSRFIDFFYCSKKNRQHLFKKVHKITAGQR
jgi:hypothetical protein